MNSDSYVNQMTHKYQLATAIAVLRNKPDNLSVEQYINVLKDKINNKLEETDEVENTVCSDDFIIDDDETMNNDFNVNDELSLDNDRETSLGTEVGNSLTILKDVHVNMEAVNDRKYIDVIDEDMTIVTEVGNSITISKDFHVNVKADNNEKLRNSQLNSVDVMKILKNIDENVKVGKTSNIEPTNTQTTFIEPSQAFDDTMVLSNANINLENIEIYNNIEVNKSNNTMNPKANNKKTAAINKNINKREINNTEHEAKVPKKAKLPKKVARNVNKVPKDAFIKENELSDINTSCNGQGNSTNTNKFSINTEKHHVLDASSKINTQKPNNVEEINSLEPNLVQKTELAKKIYNNITKNTNNVVESNQIDSQATELYSLNDITQDYTHVSQSQCDYIPIDTTFIYGNKNIKVNLRDVRDIPNIITVVTENNIENAQNQIATQNSHVIDINATEIRYLIDRNGQMFEILNVNNNKTEHNDILKSETNNQLKVSGTQYSEFSRNDLNDSVDLNIEHQASEDIELRKSIKTNEINQEYDQRSFVNENSQDLSSDDELTTSQKELVPFKVIGELNNIRSFLNKKERMSIDGNTTDSGYRSDSHGSRSDSRGYMSDSHGSRSDSRGSRSSYKNAFQPGSRLNQSAHCLLNYIVQCSLVDTTQDVSKEISKALGQLIDRLHEEQRYTLFVQDVLETIDSLLLDLCEGDSDSDNVLMKKDENIQRLILLNQSSHTLNYTIENITDILDKTYINLTSNETYELTDLNRLENTSYIFHLLEILLQKYMRNNIYSSQLTQSQEDEFTFNKSSIQDIWKKKWNPDCKVELKIEGSLEKQCALTKCGEVLNKMIVECMHGYSVIAFLALQCFNLLQS